MFQTAMGCLFTDAFLAAAHLTPLPYKETDMMKYGRNLVMQLLKNPWRSPEFKSRCGRLADINAYLRSRRFMEREGNLDDDVADDPYHSPFTD